MMVRHSIRLGRVDGAAQDAQHLRQPVYQFLGGAWREYNPAGYGNVWWRKVLSLISGLFGKGSGCANRKADGRAIKECPEDVVPKNLPDLLIVPNPHSFLVNHYPAPVDGITTSEIMRASQNGVQL